MTMAARHTIVRYRVKPGEAERNEELVRAVYGELAELDPGGFRYATYRLEDGLTFVHHAVQQGDGPAPLAGLPAFREFQAGHRGALRVGSGGERRAGGGELRRFRLAGRVRGRYSASALRGSRIRASDRPTGPGNNRRAEPIWIAQNPSRLIHMGTGGQSPALDFGKICGG